jgi:hypothetical protein
MRNNALISLKGRQYSNPEIFTQCHPSFKSMLDVINDLLLPSLVKSIAMSNHEAIKPESPQRPMPSRPLLIPF